jgi:Skp family chaperone for outer membrane proteins
MSRHAADPSTACVLACALLCAMPARAQVVMSVDSDYLMNRSAPMLAIEKARQAALAAAGPREQRAVQLAFDGERSRVLEAIAQVTAEVAASAGADLVLDIQVAQRIGTRSSGDLTQAIEKALLQRFPGEPP